MLCQNKRTEQKEKPAELRRAVLEVEKELAQSSRSSISSFILVNLGVPSFLQFLVMRDLALSFAEFHLEPFACAQNLTLQVEAAAFFRVVYVEQFLESCHDMFEVLFAARGRFDVENLAGFIDTQI